MSVLVSEDPKNLEELMSVQALNTVIEGNGIMAMYVHAPCPFCGCEKFMSFRLLDIRQTITKKHTCFQCHRSAKAVRKGNAVYTWYQIEGPDPPDFCPVKRIDHVKT